MKLTRGAVSWLCGLALLDVGSVGAQARTLTLDDAVRRAYRALTRWETARAARLAAADAAIEAAWEAGR
ncbi:MAG: hypothetical protein FJ361_01645 [Gemmatimonadetes bacterium]|nr:hypothetical protein [Gemmatimonadota bacterium]